ncbi:MAG: DUF4215 domain-containing protein [Kiritimatiellales bacterium]|nr:DUF4215 domain-containing protein [Kiritimatiellales bacterium]
MNKTKTMIGIVVGITLVIPQIFFHNEGFSFLYGAVGKGTGLNPYTISTCEELQAVNADLSANYKLVNDINCGAYNKNSLDECKTFDNKDECNANDAGCLWTETMYCEGELFDGCAYQEYDCLEWCGGNEWKTNNSCDTDLGFIPIGTLDDPFVGVLDGNGYSITNLNINRPDASNVGLFGVVDGGSVEDVRLNRVNIQGRNNLGVLAGSLLRGRVRDITITDATVKGEFNIGGIAGESKNKNGMSAIIMSSISECFINGVGGVGGLAGLNDSSLLSVLSASKCVVNGTQNVGGLVGKNIGGELIDIYSDVSVQGEVGIAGIVGTNKKRGVITNAFAVGKVDCSDCDNEHVGGLVGSNVDEGVVVTSFYLSETSDIQDQSKGTPLSNSGAGVKQSFVGWDFAETWFMNGSHPSLRALASAEDILRVLHSIEDIDEVEEPEVEPEIPIQEEAKIEEPIVESGSVLNGKVHVFVDESEQGREGMTVAASVNGGPVLSRARIGESGEYKLEIPATEYGDLVSVFIEGENRKALTLLRAEGDDMQGVDLYYNKLTLMSASGASSYTNDDVIMAITNDGVINEDLEGLIKFNELDLEFQPGMNLYIQENCIFKLKGKLTTYDLLLHGNLEQWDFDINILGEYIQKSGVFGAGKGNISFNGSVIIENGVFKGSKGTVELNDDLVGVFNIKGGEFIAPKLLIVRSKWEQTGGKFKHNKGTVQLKGTSHDLNIEDGQELFNLLVDKDDRTRVNLSKVSVNILNDLHLKNGVIDGGTLIVQSGLTISDGFDGGESLIKISESKSNIVDIATGAKYPSMEIDSTHAIVNLSGSGDDNTAIFENPITLSGGEFRINNVEVLIHDEFKLNGGSVTINDSTITFDEPIIIKGGFLRAYDGILTFKNPLELNGGNIDLRNAKIMFDDDVKIEDGTFQGGLGDITIKGSLSINEGKFIAPVGVLSIDGDINQGKGEFDNNGGMVVLTGPDSNVAVRKIQFMDLSIDKGINSVLSISGSKILVKNDLLLVGGTIDEGEIEVYGNVSSGPKYNTGTLMLRFTGEKNQTLYLENPERFHGSIDIDKIETARVELLSGIPLTQPKQNIDIVKGILDLNGQNMIFSGSTLPITVRDKAKLVLRGNEHIPALNLKTNSTVEYNLRSGPVRLSDANYYNLILDSDRGMRMFLPEHGLFVRGNLSIRGGVVESDDNQHIDLYGSWLHTGGDFVSGVGTVILKGVDSYISGNNTFFNLVKTAEDNKESFVVESDTTQIVNGTFTLSGSGCNLIQVRSSDLNTNWNLKILGQSVLKSLDISGMTYKGRILTCYSECIDRDKNDNFDFLAENCSISKQICGDGKVDNDLEECDDGNLVPSDGCSLQCQIEKGYLCREVPSICLATCGDNKVQGHETCDDGNKNDNDGCSHICFEEEGYHCYAATGTCYSLCGDGFVRKDEECDDGNDDSFDGCSRVCKVETGFSCNKAEPSVCVSECGNGTAESGEECDDGNSNSYDGCSSQCLVEPGFMCKGVPSICSVECGDGIIGNGETCDDMNKTSSDGCSKQCMVEVGYVCMGEPSDCTPLCGKDRFDSSSCNGESSYRVVLSGNQLYPPVETSLSGLVIIRLSEQNTVLYSMFLSDEDYTSINIEYNGNELLSFSGTSGQTRVLTQEELILMKSGELSVVVRTKEHPNGEVLGTITKSK